MRIYNLFESADPRAEILALRKQLPARWKNADGSESWLQPIEQWTTWFEKQPDNELPEIKQYLLGALAYLRANPKAKLPDPYKVRITRAKLTTLKILLPRVGKAYLRWLKELYKDEPNFKPDAKQLLDNLAEYLEDDLSIKVRDDGLIEFWMLTTKAAKIIGDLPVALFHYTSSHVARSIKSDGLEGDRKTVNFRQTEGVYLTSEHGGPAVEGYYRRAVAHHGGRPVVVTVKCYLSELESDPDDADISSGQHQFMVPYVPPERIVAVSKL